ncbi:MAG: glycosyltransferase [Candidatus Gastranaerophilaceae bacterium]
MKFARRLQAKYYRIRDQYRGIRRKKYLSHAKLEYGLNRDNVKNPTYIISMASYKGRYNILPIVLKSLILQTIKADRIIVWLDEENEENKITPEMEQLKQYGVEYRYTEDGLKPHKKYLYTMLEYPDANVITVDDDVIYPEDLVNSMIQYHEKYPYAICARRVHKITFDSENKLEPYIMWEYECRNVKNPSLLLCATGCGGVLYPARLLPEETLDISLIKELSLEADDIWLKMMEVRNKIPVVWVRSKYVMPLEVEESQKTALNRKNVGEGRNDFFIEKLLNKYPEVYKTLLNEEEN